MKTEAIRITTTFDVSYKMRIGSERINQFVKQAESDENNVSISKFLKLLKNLWILSIAQIENKISFETHFLLTLSGEEPH